MRFRLGTEADLLAAFALLQLHPTFRADRDLWARILPVWRQWLAAEQLSFVLWEDLRLAEPDRLRAAGMSVMVSDAFAEQAVRSGDPYPARTLYETADLPDSPVLTRAQVGVANAGEGLNLFVLHNPMRIHDLADPAQDELLPLGPQAFYFCHAGYYLRMILWECYGQQHIDYLASGGFDLLSSYRAGHSDLDDTGPQYRPFLGGLRRPENTQPFYDPIRLWMFNKVPPRLGLTAAEQRLLQHALHGYTDRELESILATSANTLKQRWHRIFERAAPMLGSADARAAGLAGGSADARAANVAPPGARWLPRRHHVLEYMRQNLHELRPYPRHRAG